MSGENKGGGISKAASGMATVVVVLIILVLGFSIIAELVGELFRALNNMVGQMGMGLSYLAHGVYGLDSSMSMFLQKIFAFGIKIALLVLGVLIIIKLIKLAREAFA